MYVNDGWGVDIAFHQENNLRKSVRRWPPSFFTVLLKKVVSHRISILIYNYV